jgi:hypothetical protein
MTDTTYKATQAGTVLIFREDVSKEEAEKALKALRSVLAYPARVKMFDPRWGEPVFYIP